MSHITNNQEIQNNKINRKSRIIHVNQQSFIGFEVFEEKSTQTKEKSKLSKIGKKLPEISSRECFKFDRNLDFSLQRNKLDKYGASEVGNILIGGVGLKDLMVNRVLKYFGMSMPFEENLYMLKGKELENLGFREFIKVHGDNIDVLYKNKYANGVDKYNYFKKMGNSKTLVGSTIDGWLINNNGDLELLEIKSSDSNYMSSAIEEYNKNGNFLSNKYFFKYYVQAQMQLACTGLENCNLFFLIGATPINCKIKRNDSLISKVLEFVNNCELEIINLRNKIGKNNAVNLLMSHNDDNHTFINFIEELVVNSDFYQSGVEFNWINEFVEYVECVDLEIKTKQSAINLECSLFEIKNLKVELNKIQNENRKKEKPIKELLKIKIDEIIRKYPLINNVNYKFREFMFNYDPNKRAISDRVKSLLPTCEKVFFSNNIAFLNSTRVPVE
ncbi:YqaJ-like recombinase domain-containing protein [Borreliella japonica]|uniref:YqaJ-like recombinase domain-containing protein n=1 Tax=Borreliella japonica TaxID=34095 RepID=A0A1G4QE59_BORJA|nr:DUF244 domain-containing protein [Borreliella japonica]SCW42711.1 YqaJ-like recombinase domain-containing protein [Borreliella japonica]